MCLFGVAMNSDAARSQVLESRSKRQTGAATASTDSPDFSETYQPRMLGDVDEVDRKPTILNPPLNVDSVPPQSNVFGTVELISSRRPRNSSVDAAANCRSDEADIVENVRSAVVDRMALAADALRQTQDVETCLQMCKLIRECADTVATLKQL